MSIEHAFAITLGIIIGIGVGNMGYTIWRKERAFRRRRNVRYLKPVPDSRSSLEQFKRMHDRQGADRG